MFHLGNRRASVTIGVVTAIIAAIATFLSFLGVDYDINTKPKLDGVHVDVSCKPSTQSKDDPGSVIDGNQSTQPNV